MGLSNQVTCMQCRWMLIQLQARIHLFKPYQLNRQLPHSGMGRPTGVAGEDEHSKQPAASKVDPTALCDQSAARLEQGIDILLKFPTYRTCEYLLQSLPHMVDVWISPTMIRHCLGQVWSEYGEYLCHPRSHSKTKQMAVKLSNNGKNPIVMNQKIEWSNWFGGPRLRWEMMSILFSFFGRSFKQREEWDPVFSFLEQEGRE